MLNAIAILVGTHGFATVLLLIFMLEGMLIVMINGNLLAELLVGRVAWLGTALLMFSEDVIAFVTLRSVLSRLTFATVLTTIRVRRVSLIVV